MRIVFMGTPSFAERVLLGLESDWGAEAKHCRCIFI